MAAQNFRADKYWKEWHPESPGGLPAPSLREKAILIGTMKLVTLIVALIAVDALPTTGGDHSPGRPLARETLRVEFLNALFPDSCSVALEVKVTNIGPYLIHLPRHLHRYTRFTIRHEKTTHVQQPTDHFTESDRYEAVEAYLEPGQSCYESMQFKASRGDAIRMTLALPPSGQDDQTPRGSLATEWFQLVGWFRPIPTMGNDLIR